MAETLRIGIAGLGTVGMGTCHIIQEHASLLAKRCRKNLTITSVSSRNRTADRGMDLSAYHWYDDARELAKSTDVDVVVELIGGDEGIARETVEIALSHGKHVVTANKALISKHGAALAALAELVHAVRS